MYSLGFAVVISARIILIPLFKKASSRILFCKIVELNFVEVKISFDGKKVIFVPFFLVFPISFNGFTELPLLKAIKYSLPSRKMFNSNLSERALTTETPTPCKPPETL